MKIFTIIFSWQVCWCFQCSHNITDIMPIIITDIIVTDIIITDIIITDITITNITIIIITSPSLTRLEVLPVVALAALPARQPGRT